MKFIKDFLLKIFLYFELVKEFFELVNEMIKLVTNYIKNDVFTSLLYNINNESDSLNQLIEDFNMRRKIKLFFCFFLMLRHLSLFL